MLSRRHLLAGAVSIAAAPLATSAFAQPAAAAPPAASDPAEAARLNTLMDAIMQRNLRRGPETASSMGLDKGDLAWTKAELSVRSLAGLAQTKAFNAEHLAQVRAIRRDALAGMDRINLDTVEFTLAVDDEANRKFEYGGYGWGAPYLISQLTGAYQSVPDFLDNQHTIETKDDADAYLARIDAYGRQLDEEVEVARHDAALGVVPPDFVIDKALIQMKAFRDTPVEETTVVASLARRAKEKGLSGDLAAQAATLYRDSVLPALDRQIALLQGWRPSAVHDAGVWRLKDGAEYYAVSLRGYTTSKITPDEVHQMGLDQAASISAQINGLMKKLGMTKGTVGERLRAMATDPKYLYPNTDEAKDRLIADLNAQVKVIQAQLPAYFGQLPKTGVDIRRVPKAIEAGAPGGYYNSPPVDGSRPGIYWINLRDTGEVPTWTLPTLTYHEAIPGHHLQLALANEAEGLPLLRKAIGNSGYIEGWALYAEQVAADEMGMYAKDPAGHIGQLHDALFRAMRLVVDSGMHHKRWSREQAVKYASELLGDQESQTITEIERYCVWPGQACSYMVGKLTWLRLRDKAKKALGRRFDIRRFHDVGLLSGVMPLDVLERRVDDYIGATKA